MRVIKVIVDIIPEKCDDCSFCVDNYGCNDYCAALPIIVDGGISDYTEISDTNIRRSDCPLELDGQGVKESEGK